MVEKLQRRFALSRKGAVDTIKGSLLCALQNISFMLPVYMLYCPCVGYARRRAHGLAHPVLRRRHGYMRRSDPRVYISSV